MAERTTVTERVEAPIKRRIEKVALDLFATQGYRGTSVKEIMLACGLTSGALYNHFASKDELLNTILTRFGDELTVVLQRAEAAADPDDPADMLFNVIEAMARFALLNPRATKVANVDYTELSDGYLAKEVAFRRSNRQRIERILDAGIRAGRFVVPEYGGDDEIADREIKLVATALANVAIRMSELAGPDPGGDIDGLARFHAKLALQMVTRRTE